MTSPGGQADRRMGLCGSLAIGDDHVALDADAFIHALQHRSDALWRPDIDLSARVFSFSGR